MISLAGYALQTVTIYMELCVGKTLISFFVFVFCRWDMNRDIDMYDDDETERKLEQHYIYIYIYIYI